MSRRRPTRGEMRTGQAVKRGRGAGGSADQGEDRKVSGRKQAEGREEEGAASHRCGVQL